MKKKKTHQSSMTESQLKFHNSEMEFLMQNLRQDDVM